jgi:hypothetical protein
MEAGEMRRLIVMVLAAAALTSLGVVSVVADGDEQAICCEFSNPDCPAQFPQCYIVGADCDPSNIPGRQGYCMGSSGL